MERLVADNLSAWHEHRLDPSRLASEDDGAGDPFCVRIAADSGDLIRWSYIDCDVANEPQSMTDFIREWLAG
jgi:hypothetical protein